MERKLDEERLRHINRSMQGPYSDTDSKKLLKHLTTENGNIKWMLDDIKQRLLLRYNNGVV